MYAIMDLGSSVDASDPVSGETIHVPRYGSFRLRRDPEGTRLDELVETADDIGYLQTKYNTTKTLIISNGHVVPAVK